MSSSQDGVIYNGSPARDGNFLFSLCFLQWGRPLFLPLKLLAGPHTQNTCYDRDAATPNIPHLDLLTGSVCTGEKKKTEEARCKSLRSPGQSRLLGGERQVVFQLAARDHLLTDFEAKHPKIAATRRKEVMLERRPAADTQPCTETVRDAGENLKPKKWWSTWRFDVIFLHLGRKSAKANPGRKESLLSGTVCLSFLHFDWRKWSTPTMKSTCFYCSFLC